MIAIALLVFLGCQETYSCQLKFKQEDEQFTSANASSLYNSMHTTEPPP